MADLSETIFTDLTAKKADLITLILTSQNIESLTIKQENLISIQVAPADTDRALLMVNLYYKENKFFRIKQQVSQIPISSFKSWPAFCIMALLALIHAAASHYQVHEQMVMTYGSSAMYILQGEISRAVTALFLHADARHLLGNMAGMVIFAAPVISLTGFGTGPFMLLTAGTLGNLINALFYKNAHLSIGASTTVMGAAGILAAYQIMKRPKLSSMNDILPLLAGAVLVGLFSQGERTDIWAHVFGFFCGLGIGSIFFPLKQIFGFKPNEPVFLALTLTLATASFLF